MAAGCVPNHMTVINSNNAPLHVVHTTELTELASFLIAFFSPTFPWQTAASQTVIINPIMYRCIEHVQQCTYGHWGDKLGKQNVLGREKICPI